MKQPTKEELRNNIKKLKQMLTDAVTLNIITGKLISLLGEFDLSHDEKVDIIRQFVEVKTVCDADTLYLKIKKELRNKQQKENINNNENLYYIR